MKKILFAGALTLAALQMNAEESKVIRISTDQTDLILKVGENGRLYQTYLGEKLLHEADVNRFSWDIHAGSDGSISQRGWEVYSGSGNEDYFEPAVAITHNDGNTSTYLYYVSSSTSPVEGGTQTTINLRDDKYPVDVTLHYVAYPKENVIKTWSEIKHQEKKPIILSTYASTMLYFCRSSYYLTEFSSDWAKEARMSSQQLQFGKKVIDTKLGSRAAMHTHPFFEVGLDQPVSENQGDVLMGTLGWTGNFRFTFEVDNENGLRVLSGINPYASEYSLKPNEVFRTPEFIFTYSTEGKGKASRDFQRWARKYQLKDGEKSRMTLLNNWEATYFDFNEDKLVNIMDEAVALGVDMFLLDDGWFANKYPRSSDHQGLGDWEETVTKLPNGIGKLVKEATDRGIKFGLWIEPEMVNPKSELYEKHKDWVIHLPNRDEYYFRNQMVLDLTNPKVQDFVFGVVNNLMTNYPEIAYMKWDDNCSLLDYGSSYLPKNKQSHLYIEYNRGLQKVLQRIRAKYPELVMQLCAGGGARVNYGLLPYFDEFWTSDDTDALQRIYMQWGVSGFFPAIAMASHVSADKNHQTGRRIPLKFRFDVAMSGRLGMEIQPKDMNDVDKAFSKRAIAAYKDIRPVVQFGDLYRLVSPYDNKGVSSLMYVTSEKNKAVFYAYKISHFINMVIPKVCMNGLDPSKNYRLVDLTPVDSSKPCDLNGKIISGKILMEEGIALKSLLKSEYSSLVLQLQAVD